MLAGVPLTSPLRALAMPVMNEAPAGRAPSSQVSRYNRAVMTPVRLADRDARALDEFVRTVRARLGPNLVTLTLFGSKARGDATPESDLDVLVVVTDHRLEAENSVLDIAFDVSLAHDVYISPRVIERSTIEHPVWRRTPFLQAIERDGVPL